MRFDIHPVCRLKYFRIWSRFCGDILHVSLTELNLIICICYCSNYKKKFHKNVDPVCHDSNSFGQKHLYYTVDSTFLEDFLIFNNHANLTEPVATGSVKFLCVICISSPIQSNIQ